MKTRNKRTSDLSIYCSSTIFPSLVHQLVERRSNRRIYLFSIKLSLQAPQDCVNVRFLSRALPFKPAYHDETLLRHLAENWLQSRSNLDNKLLISSNSYECTPFDCYCTLRNCAFPQTPQLAPRIPAGYFGGFVYRHLLYLYIKHLDLPEVNAQYFIRLVGKRLFLEEK